MNEVAKEYFTAHPECQFVSVIEHAGWFLGFRRDGSIWGTANDRAILAPGPRPNKLERIIRRQEGTDHWL